MINRISEPRSEAFTRNHLVISMHQPVGLEVQAPQGYFLLRAIEGGRCSVSRR